MSEVKSSGSPLLALMRDVETPVQLCSQLALLFTSGSMLHTFSTSSVNIRQSCIDKGLYEINQILVASSLKRLEILQKIVEISSKNNINVSGYVKKQNKKWKLFETSVKNEFTVSVNNATDSALKNIETSKIKHKDMIEKIMNFPFEFITILTTPNCEDAMNIFKDEAKLLPSLIEELSNDCANITSEYVDILNKCVVSAKVQTTKQSEELFSKIKVEIAKKFNDNEGVCKYLLESI